MTKPADYPFTLDGVAWQIYVAGRVLPIEFNSRGAALAGIGVERRRMSLDKEVAMDEYIESHAHSFPTETASEFDGRAA